MLAPLLDLVFAHDQFGGSPGWGFARSVCAVTVSAFLSKPQQLSWEPRGDGGDVSLWLRGPPPLRQHDRQVT